MQPVNAHIDCGATSIFISPSLIWKLELPHKPTFTSTQCLNSQVMMSAKAPRNARLLVHNFEHLKPVDELEVTVVPMKAYDLVLGLPGFKARNPEIDWTKGQWIALERPNGLQRANIPDADYASPLPERGDASTHVDPPPDIQLLGATAFHHLLASEEVVEEFAIRLGECQGLVGVSLDGKGNRRLLNAGAGAVAVVAAEE
jgi:hypothetical protein